MKNNKRRTGSIFSPACVIFFSAVFSVAVGCKSGRPLSSQTVMDISYGPDKENTLDVSLPEGRTGSTPALILIHGGAWTGGDKSDFAFLRGYFSDREFAVFSVNYRLAKTEGTGIRDILQDMNYVMSYVKKNSAYWTYSADNVFIAGHSAGGHIALLYSFSMAREGAIRGVITYCGFADLTDPELEKSLNRMDWNQLNSSGKPFDRLGFVAGPGIESRRAYSPQFITSNIPVLLFCGKMDDIIPWTQSENLHKKMKENGYDSTLYVYPDMGHDVTPHYGEIMDITGKWIRDKI